MRKSTSLGNVQQSSGQKTSFCNMAVHFADEEPDCPPIRVMEEKKCPINLRLLPIKAHYFFFYGAMGGVMPYMTLMAKGLGINATAVGLVFTLVPFCVFFSKPVFGFITDYFRNIKLIVCILVCVTSCSYLSAVFIPAIDNRHWTEVGLSQCDSSLMLLQPYGADRKCLLEGLEHDQPCELSYRLCGSDSPVTLTGNISVYHPGWEVSSSSGNRSSAFLTGLDPKDLSGDTRNKPSVASPLLRNSSSMDVLQPNSTLLLRFLTETNFTCDCLVANSSQIRCSSPLMNSCFPGGVAGSVYWTFQFWLFTLFTLIAGTGAATVFCLSDAACYEVLGDHPQNYGRQRLWGTISWGCVTLLAGLLNDVATNASSAITYAPGFYVMFGLVVVDLLLLLKIKLTKTNFSLSICQDIGKIFSSCESVAFAVAVYIIGALTGLIWNYQFWYLQDLGARQTLLGLTVAVQCIVAEVPFFFFAGWFIKKFGYFFCLSGSFAAFALRLGLYSVLENPWFVLPIEPLHGLTFAVFYSCMTGYASNYAPPGTEATMMGILGGLFEGLGVATGSLLGGLGFDKLGGRNTFFTAFVISVICAPAFTLVHVCIRRLVGPRQER